MSHLHTKMWKQVHVPEAWELSSLFSNHLSDISCKVLQFVDFT